MVFETLCNSFKLVIGQVAYNRRQLFYCTRDVQSLLQSQAFTEQIKSTASDESSAD